MILRGFVAALVSAVALQPGFTTEAAGASWQTSATCDRAQARAALDHTGLLAAGDKVAQLVCLDLNRDGRADLAATVGVPGSAGVVGWAAFVAHGDSWRLLQRHPDAYRPSLVKLGADLLEYESVYRKGDPNCCPTGGSVDRLYRWRGDALSSSRRGGSRRPSPT